MLGAPLFLVLPTVFQTFKVIGWLLLISVAVAIAATVVLLAFSFFSKRQLEREYRELGARICAPRVCSDDMSPPADQIAHEAIGYRSASCVADSASNHGGHMKHDTRFALIDTAGDERFAARINGTFQIGKERDATTTDIEAFARAVLIDGQGGRFVCSDGRKPAVLKFSGRAKEAVAYRLDPAIARKLGIAPAASDKSLPHC
ncbi:hypothetical protein FHT02_004434 [Sphingomonas xinjiangensis]|uniref:Uncharacterized protein n=2 Tax=Sphingomonas xinjiangensis TaxID=643568 RepID=A0A840YTZ7_9SPHN|nr:hypothetical protein [Sphingomonas xinjiangensis]